MDTEYIKQAFAGYLDSDDRQAVMLKADWGAGKSHFVTQELVPIIERKSKKLIRICLFGVSSADQLRQALISASLLVSENGKTIVRFAGKTVETLVGVLSDTGGKAIQGLTGVIGNLANEQAFKSIDGNSVVIIENFERSQLPIKVAMGMINKLMEEQGAKVLIVAAPERIVDDTGYSAFREKIIRYQWELHWSPDQIFEIVTAGQKGTFKVALDDYRGYLVDFIEASQVKNLRTWLTAIGHTANALEGIKADNPILNKTQVELFLYAAGVCIFREVEPLKSGSKYWYNPNHSFLDVLEEKDTSFDLGPDKGLKLSQYLEQLFEALAGQLSIFSSTELYNLIESGYIDPKALLQEIEDRAEAQNDQVQDYLSSYFCMDNEAFKQRNTEVNQLLAEGEVKDSVTFSHLHLVQSWLREADVIDESEHDLQVRWVQYTETVMCKGGFEFNPDPFAEPLQLTTDKCSDSVQAVRDLIVEKNNESRNKVEGQKGAEFWSELKQLDPLDLTTAGRYLMSYRLGKETLFTKRGIDVIISVWEGSTNETREIYLRLITRAASSGTVTGAMREDVAQAFKDLIAKQGYEGITKMQCERLIKGLQVPAGR